MSTPPRPSTGHVLEFPDDRPILPYTMCPIDSTPAQLMDELRKAIHEMNNAMTPVLANAQLARLMVDPSTGELDEILEDIVEASSRAKGTAVEIRTIARRLREELPETAGVGEGRRETNDG